MTSCFSFLTEARPRHSKDGPWAWLALFYSSLCAVFTGGIQFGFGIILPVLMVDLNENRENIALVGSLRIGITLFFCVFTTKACERHGCRIVNAFGLMLIIVGLILSSLCKIVLPLYFTYSLLTGMGGACIFAAHYLMLRQYFKKRFSLAAGIRAAAVGVGMLSTGPFTQYLIDRYEWRNTFRILAGTLVPFVPFSLIFDPNVENCEEQMTTTTATVEECPVEKDKLKPKPRKIAWGILDLSVWTFPEYTMCVVAIFIGCWGHYTPMIHMIKYSEELGISPTKSSTLLVFVGIATIVSRVICGRLCDVRFIKARYIHQAGVIVSGISTILLTFAVNYTHLIIFSLVYGIADGAFRVTTNILFMNTVDIPRKPSAFGQANMITSLSNAAGPAIAGMMADSADSYISAFYMAGLVSITGGLIFFIHICFFKNKAKNREEVVVSSITDHPLACNGPASFESHRNL